MKVLIIRPEDSTTKGHWIEGMEFVPRKGDQMHFKGKSYDVAVVKYFVDADGIKEYEKNTPFVRIILMNQ